MKKIKYAFYIIIGCVAFVAMGVRGFAEDGAQTPVYLSVFVTDDSTVRKTEEELSKIAKAFTVEMTGGGTDCTSRLSESGECIMEGNQYNFAKFLGCFNADSAYSISYQGVVFGNHLFSDTSKHLMDLEGLPNCEVSCYLAKKYPDTPHLLIVNVRVKDPVIFLATSRVMADNRPVGSQPSAEEIRKRFAIKVSGTINNPANEEERQMTQDGIFGKVIGEVAEDSKVGVLYNGKAVGLVYAPVLETNSFDSIWRSPDGIEFALGFVLHPDRDTSEVQLGELVIAICGDKCE